MNATHLIQLKSPSLKSVLMLALALNIAAGVALGAWDLFRPELAGTNHVANLPLEDLAANTTVVMPYVEPLSAP
jgi:hypothetical protein